MRTFVIVTALVAACLGAAPGHADAPGLPCHFTTSDEPTQLVADPGTPLGELDGGPVLVADLPDATGNPASATVTCALQVDGTGMYAEPDAAAASASGTVAVYLPPTFVTHHAVATDTLWLCTTWTVTDAHGAGETRYLDATTGAFSTDPATARCALVPPPGEVVPART